MGGAATDSRSEPMETNSYEPGAELEESDTAHVSESSNPVPASTLAENPRVKDPGPFYRLGVQNSHGQTSYFEVIDAAMDGNCMFRALSEALHGHQNEHLEIRQAIVRYILDEAHWPEFAIHIEGQRDDYEQRGKRIAAKRAQLNQAQSSASDNELQGLYREVMTTVGTFGTFTELIAAADLFEFNLVLIRMQSTTLFSVPPSKPTSYNQTFHFFFTGIGPNSGHFEFLKPSSPIPNSEPVTYPIENGFYDLETIDLYCVRIHPHRDLIGIAMQSQLNISQSSLILSNGQAEGLKSTAIEISDMRLRSGKIVKRT